MPDISLPDGSLRHYDHPISISQIAADIGPSLSKSALAGQVDGKLVDTSFVIEHDTELRIITSQDSVGLEIIR